MGSSDGDCQGVNPGSLNKFFHFVGIGIAGVLLGDNHLVLHTGQCAQLCLDNNAVIMGVLHYLTGNLNIFIERLGRSVNHNGGEPIFDALLTSFKGVAVIQMQGDGQSSFNFCRLNQLDKISGIGIAHGTGRDLEDHRSTALFCRLCNSLDNLHIVGIEGTDGVTALVGLAEHFGRRDKRHHRHSLSLNYFHFNIGSCLMQEDML